jgi:predicted RNase H-like HicB family nuclease
MKTPTPTFNQKIDTVEVDKGTLADGSPAFVARDTAFDGLMAQASTEDDARAALELARPEYLAAMAAQSHPVPPNLSVAQAAIGLTSAVKTFFFGFEQSPTTLSHDRTAVPQT